MSFVCYGQTECYEGVASVSHVFADPHFFLSERLQPSGGDDSRVYDLCLLLPITGIAAAAGRRSQYVGSEVTTVAS